MSHKSRHLCSHAAPAHPNRGEVSGSGREGGGVDLRRAGGERGPQLVPQIPNLIGSVISALLIDGYNPPESLEGQAGVLRVWEITRLTGVER